MSLSPFGFASVPRHAVPYHSFPAFPLRVAAAHFAATALPCSEVGIWKAADLHPEAHEILRTTPISTSNPALNTLVSLVQTLSQWRGLQWGGLQLPPNQIVLGGSFISSQHFKTSFNDIDLAVLFPTPPPGFRSLFVTREDAERFTDQINYYLTQIGLSIFAPDGGGKLDILECAPGVFAIKCRLNRSAGYGSPIDIIFLDEQSYFSVWPDSSRSALIWQCVANAGAPDGVHMQAASLLPMDVLAALNAHRVLYFFPEALGLDKRIAVWADKVSSGRSTRPYVVQSKKIIEKYIDIICVHLDGAYPIVGKYEPLKRAAIFNSPPDVLRLALKSAFTPAPESALAALRAVGCAHWLSEMDEPEVTVPVAAAVLPVKEEILDELAVPTTPVVTLPIIKKTVAPPKEKAILPPPAPPPPPPAQPARDSWFVAGGKNALQPAPKKVVASAPKPLPKPEPKPVKPKKEKAVVAALCEPAPEPCARDVVAEAIDVLKKTQGTKSKVTVTKAELKEAWRVVTESFFTTDPSARKISARQILNFDVNWDQLTDPAIKTPTVVMRLILAHEQFSGDGKEANFALCANEFCSHAVASFMSDEQMQRASACLLKVVSPASAAELGWFLNAKDRALRAGVPSPSDADFVLPHALVCHVLETSDLGTKVVRHIMNQRLQPKFLTAPNATACVLAEDVPPILAMLRHVSQPSDRFKLLRRVLQSPGALDLQKNAAAKALLDELVAAPALTFTDKSLESVCCDASLPYLGDVFGAEHVCLLGNPKFYAKMVRVFSSGDSAALEALPDTALFLPSLCVAWEPYLLVSAMTQKLPLGAYQKLLRAFAHPRQQGAFLAIFKGFLKSFGPDLETNLRRFTNGTLAICLSLLVMRNSAAAGAAVDAKDGLAAMLKEILGLSLSKWAFLYEDKAKIAQGISKLMGHLFEVMPRAQSLVACDAAITRKTLREFCVQSLPAALARACVAKKISSPSVDLGFMNLGYITKACADVCIRYLPNPTTHGHEFIAEFAASIASLEHCFAQIESTCTPHLKPSERSDKSFQSMTMHRYFIVKVFILDEIGDVVMLASRAACFVKLAGSSEFAGLNLREYLTEKLAVAFARDIQVVCDDFAGYSYLLNMLYESYSGSCVPSAVEALKQKLFATKKVSGEAEAAWLDAETKVKSLNRS